MKRRLPWQQRFLHAVAPWYDPLEEQRKADRTETIRLRAIAARLYVESLLDSVADDYAKR